MSDISKIFGVPEFSKISNVTTSNVKSVLGSFISGTASPFYGNFSYYVDGVYLNSLSATDLNDGTSTPIVNPTAPTQVIFDLLVPEESYPSIYRIDNFMISNDISRDLYAVRDVTSKPTGEDIVFYWGMNGNPNSLTFSGNDYGVGNPSLIIRGMLPQGLDPTDFKTGNGSGYIYHNSSSDDSYTLGFAVDGLSNLPLKGRMGFYIKFANAGDERMYAGSFRLGVGTGYTSAGLAPGSSFTGMQYSRITANPSPFGGGISVFSSGYDLASCGFWDAAAPQEYDQYIQSARECFKAGDWHFLEFVYDLVGN